MSAQPGSPSSKVSRYTPSFLEALPVDNRRAGLIVLLLADPHALERTERGQDRTTNPDRVFTLRRRDDLNLDAGRGERRDLLRHTLRDSGEHGGTTRKDDVGVQVLTDIDVALHDGLEGRVGDAVHLESGQVGLEEDLRTAEAFVSDDDDVTVGKLEGLLEVFFDDVYVTVGEFGSSVEEDIIVGEVKGLPMGISDDDDVAVRKLEGLP